jgi:UDP-N-acetylglucosamine 2-epimerase (non-hydrolysing)
MKVITILGTRPEIIRLSRVIPLLDELCNHCVINTGQNFDSKLNGIFFTDLGLRKPNYLFDTKSETTIEQIAKILIETEKILIKEKPDRVLLLGDTNSALTAIVAKRMHIPVFHMEAGNRCFDDRVPEEVNRRIIDHSTDIAMPYTERSRENLLREGILSKKIYVTGNPIFEVIEFYSTQIEASDILNSLKIEKQNYFLVTLHRQENVDVPERLNDFIESFKMLFSQFKLPIVISLHPRTRSQLAKQSKAFHNEMIIMEPIGFFEFVHLEKNALCVLSDSGTVQEECSIFRVPNVTLRDVTERPETVEAGSNFVVGCNPASINRAIKTVMLSPGQWEPPVEYLKKNVSQTVSKIVLAEYTN